MKTTILPLLKICATPIVVAIACAPANSGQRQTVATTDRAVVAVPVIDSARPDSAVVPYGGVVEVTLYGKWFIPGQPGHNTVNFAGTSLSSIAASADGQRIVFVVPDQISGSGGSPPIRLVGGAYPVSVQTPGGTSNTVTVRVYR